MTTETITKEQCLTCGQINGCLRCSDCGRHMLHTAEPWMKLCGQCWRALGLRI